MTEQAVAHAQRVPPSLGRMVRFALVGGSGFLLNIALLLLLVEVAGWSYLVAALVAIEASTLSNYMLNRFWTWRDRPAGAMSVLHYHAVVAAGVVTQFLVLTASVEVLGLHYVWGSLLGVAAGTVLNFLGNEHLTFGRFPRLARYVTAFVLYVLVAAVLSHAWDTFVFERSTEDFVRDGTTPYETAEEAPPYTFRGTWLPPMQQWYAYPPLPLLMMAVTGGPGFLLNAPEMVARVLVKLPAITGALAVAALGRNLLVRRDGDTQRADQAENWLLFGPVALVVAGIWGQFEPVLVAFMLGSILALRKQRWTLAGVLVGAACLIKLFPLFLAPLLIAYVVRRAGWRPAASAAAAAAGTFVAVSLPFLLLAQDGFMQQVFWMHAERPPARLSPLVGVLWLAKGLPGLVGFGAPSPESLVRPLSILSFGATAVVILLLVLGNRLRDEKDLVAGIAVTFGMALLTTKVLNEQYLYLPFVFFTLAWLQTGPRRILHAASAARGLAVAVAAAALVSNLALLRFVVPEVAARLYPGGDAAAVAAHWAAALGVGVGTLMVVSNVVTGVLVAIPFLFMIRSAAPVMRRGAERLGRLGSVPKPMRRATVPAVLALLVLTPALVASAGVAMDDRGGPDAAATSQWAWLRPDQINPTNDPERAAGTWAHSPVQPEIGYYSTSSYSLHQAVTTLHGAGVDGIIVEAVPSAWTGVTAAEALVRRQGLAMAWGIAPERIHPDGDVPLTWDTAAQFGQVVDSATELRDAPVVVRSVDRLGVPGDEAQREFIIEVAKAEAPLVAQALDSPAGLADDEVWQLATEIARAAWLRHVAGDGILWVAGEDLQVMTIGNHPERARRALETVDADAPWIVPWNDQQHWGALEPSTPYGRQTLTAVEAWLRTQVTEDEAVGSAGPRPEPPTHEPDPAPTAAQPAA